MESAALSMGERLKYVRGSSSQKAFASELGVALSSYQNYERGDREPTLQVLCALVDRGWSAHWLLTGKGPERLNSEVGHSESQPVGLTPGNVQAAAEAVALALEMLDLEAEPSAIGVAVLALARWADAQDAAKLRVADLLRRAKTILTTGSTTDEQ